LPIGIGYASCAQRRLSIGLEPFTGIVQVRMRQLAAQLSAAREAGSGHAPIPVSCAEQATGLRQRRRWRMAA